MLMNFRFRPILPISWQIKTLIVSASLLAFGVPLQPVMANLTITPSTNSTALGNALRGNNVTISNVTVNQGTVGGQTGTFNGGKTGGAGPVIGVEDGIVLVTGDVNSALGPNNAPNRTTGSTTDTFSDPDLATIDNGLQRDTVVLEFDVVPTGQYLALDFIFASEEYNEYVCTTFNDAMGVFVSGPGISGKVNIAKQANGTPLSINEINVGTPGSANATSPAPCNTTNTAFYVQNTGTQITNGRVSDVIQSTNFTNTQYDGFTKPLTSTIAVTPGQTYHFKIVIADIGDNQYDAAAFIDLIRSYDLDYGDAPETYGTQQQNQAILLAGGGARHLIDSVDLYLGSLKPDAESSVSPATSPNPANGDDSVGSDDEDAFSGDIVVSSGATSFSLNNIPVKNATGTGATLVGWIDFNKNGTFEVSEGATATVNSGSTTANLSWSGLSGVTAGTTYARFRITTDPTVTRATPNGLAVNGEVEDYRVIVATPPRLRLVKRITAINATSITSVVAPTTTTDPNDDNSLNWPSGYLRGATDGGLVKPGDDVEYTIYFLSDGGNDATDVRVCDLVPNNTTFLATAFNNSTPTDGGLPGTDLGMALALGSTTPTAYLTNVSDTPDRGQFFAPGTSAPAACNSSSFTTPVPGSSNVSGAVVVDVVKSPTNLPKATAPGTPANSYGFVRFRVRVK